MGELNINIDNKSNCDDNITLYILIRCKKSTFYVHMGRHMTLFYLKNKHS